MFLVGGGILVHGIPVLHGWIEGLAHRVAASPGVGPMLRIAITLLLNAVTGIVAGTLVLAIASGVRRMLRPGTSRPAPR
jgi:hypothetical protein